MYMFPRQHVQIISNTHRGLGVLASVDEVASVDVHVEQQRVPQRGVVARSP
jgi:hypothetical protein